MHRRGHIQSAATVSSHAWVFPFFFFFFFERKRKRVQQDDDEKEFQSKPLRETIVELCLFFFFSKERRRVTRVSLSQQHF
jgi:hypothetical protein